MKHLEWAKKYLEKKDTFNDMIWTDESNVQMESHKSFSFRQQGCQHRLKPRYVVIHVHVCMLSSSALGRTFCSTQIIVSRVCNICSWHTNSCKNCMELCVDVVVEPS